MRVCRVWSEWVGNVGAMAGRTDVQRDSTEHILQSQSIGSNMDELELELCTIHERPHGDSIYLHSFRVVPTSLLCVIA